MILKIVDDDRETCVIVTRIDRRKDISGEMAKAPLS